MSTSKALRYVARAYAALLIAISSAATAQVIPPPAYQLAARQVGVPSPVLFAVALQESGMRLHGRLIPWPWTLNIAGRAQRYSTRVAACAGLRRALVDFAADRIDAGLGQINVGYQAQRYDHPCELLDPYRNLAIAASILLEQHASGEDWLLAIGRYHRPAGGEPAARYRRSVAVHLRRVLGQPARRPQSRARSHETNLALCRCRAGVRRLPLRQGGSGRYQRPDAWRRAAIDRR